MATIQIKYCDIPSYLHAGDFYRNLDSGDPEGIIEIPADCFHPDGETAADLEEFRQLLRVMAFWVLYDIPTGVLNYCYEHDITVWDKGLVDLPGAVDAEMRPFLFIAFGNTEGIPLGDIMKTGRWDLIVHAVGYIDKSRHITAFAASLSDPRLLKYLHEQGFVWHDDTCASASQNGRVECLQFAHENGCPWDVQVYLHAAENGHQLCMKFAFEQGLEWDAAVCIKAASTGHLDCLRFAHDNGCPWDERTTEIAAQEGHMHCLQYALEHGCAVDRRACNMACKNGHLECLQLLHRFGAPRNEKTSFYAVHGPDVACLQFLHENGCPWDEDTSGYAAQQGHIQPLTYALGQGCPYDVNIVIDAVRGGNLESLRYLVEDQVLYMCSEVFKTALLTGNLICLQYLVGQGCPYLDAKYSYDADQWKICDYVFRKDNPEFVRCVQFAVERGWVPCKNFINYVVARDEACKLWLIMEGYYAEEMTIGVEERTIGVEEMTIGGSDTAVAST